MRASLSIRGAAAAGLVTLAVSFGAAPQANAEDVTIEVWSHEAARTGGGGIPPTGR